MQSAYPRLRSIRAALWRPLPTISASLTRRIKKSCTCPREAVRHVTVRRPAAWDAIASTFLSSKYRRRTSVGVSRLNLNIQENLYTDHKMTSKGSTFNLSISSVSTFFTQSLLATSKPSLFPMLHLDLPSTNYMVGRRPPSPVPRLL